jgi:hypothetical protein
MGRCNIHAFRFHDKSMLSCETEYFTLFIPCIATQLLHLKATKCTPIITLIHLYSHFKHLEFIVCGTVMRFLHFNKHFNIYYIVNVKVKLTLE